MKKHFVYCNLPDELQQCFRVMKISALLLFLCVNIIASNSIFSQAAKVSINAEQKTLKEVFSEIEANSGYLFFFNDQVVDLDKKIDVSLKDASLDVVLSTVLDSKSVGYEVSGRQIVLYKKDAPRAVIEEAIANAAQQKKSISGKVVDNAGQPMVGVTVLEKGTNNGAMTDVDGNFSLSVASGAELQVSYLGYVTQLVAVGNQSSLNVVLLEDQQLLDEIVVVGYGTVKKSDLTGSVSSLTSKTFIEQPASSANSILSGRAAGVTVRKMTGNPGEGSSIRIRGANSVTGSSDPLIVVDGNYGGMPNAYDIESIEILKDASATAIYGSRGANGVILVTTKRGKEGKPTLSLYADFSIDKITKRYDNMNAYEFADYNNSTGAYPFTDEEMAYFKANPEGTNWQDEILRTALSQNYKAILTGGAKNIKYYVSPYYNKATGIVRNTESTSFGLNAKVDAELSSRVSVQVEANLGHRDNVNPEMATGGNKTSIPLMAAMVWSPTEPVYEDDGRYNALGIGTGTILNPLLLTTIDDNRYSNNGGAVGNLKVKIIDGLVLDAKGSYSFGTGGRREFESLEYNTVHPTARLNSYEDKTWLVNSYLTYTKAFADIHNFSVMAGFEQTQSESQNSEIRATELALGSMEWYNMNVANKSVIGSAFGNNALRSYFGRINYNYDSRYYLTANFRSDGSSRFRPGKQFSYFPSFSLAWRLTEEKFMKDQNFFQNIKVRGGWGITGNQSVANYSRYALLRARNYSWGASIQPGYVAEIGGSPNLEWEKTRQLNIGLDLTLVNNRLAISLDYYNKKTTDLLAPVAVPAYNGGDSEYGRNEQLQNVGSVRNEGFEFNINYNVFETKNFAYEVNFNGAFNNNKVLDLEGTDIVYGQTYAPGVASISPFALMPGNPIGTIYGLEYMGIWQENQAEEAAKYGQSPGDYRYRDLDGDYQYTADDKMAVGNTNPKFTWGLNNHFSYKEFGLNILFEGVHGRDILNWSRMIASERIDFKQTYTSRESRNRWTPENPNAEFSKEGSQTSRLNPVSSHYMEDGSYVKLRNISLSYMFPRKYIPFADVKLSVSAQNLVTFTKYKGYDPEISSTRAGEAGVDASSGMDWFAYPNPKSFSVGISVTY